MATPTLRIIRKVFSLQLLGARGPRGNAGPKGDKGDAAGVNDPRTLIVSGQSVTRADAGTTIYFDATDEDVDVTWDVVEGEGYDVSFVRVDSNPNNTTASINGGVVDGFSFTQQGQSSTIASSGTALWLKSRI